MDRAGIAVFCRRNHIRKLAIFGSALREDFRPDILPPPRGTDRDTFPSRALSVLGVPEIFPAVHDYTLGFPPLSRDQGVPDLGTDPRGSGL